MERDKLQMAERRKAIQQLYSEDNGLRVYFNKKLPLGSILFIIFPCKNIYLFQPEEE